MRHYSKLLVHLPDSPSDPPEVRIEMDCDVCGELEISFDVAHIGTLYRLLADIFHSSADDGTSKMFGSFPSKERAKAIRHLNKHFPEWKTCRIRSLQKA